MEQTLTPIGELIAAGPTAQPTPLKQLLRSDGISKLEHAALVEERKDIAQRGGRPPAVQPTRDILLQGSYADALRIAPKVMKRLEEALDDKFDGIHERAVDILAKRTMPIAFFESLAKSEFKTEEEGGARPRITINITTSGVTPIAAVLTQDEVVDVPFKELP